MSDEKSKSQTSQDSYLELTNMKFVFVIVTIMSLGGLTGCQPNAGGNVVTSDMDGGSDGGTGY